MSKQLLQNLSFTTFIMLDTRSSGSGFRLQYKDEIYLVTAKHVLFDAGDNLRFNEATLTSKKSRAHDMETRRVTLKSQKLNILRSKNFDIAAILLEPKKMFTLQDGYDIVDLRSDQCLKYEKIKVADNIYMIGFPSSLVLTETAFFEMDRPLITNGIVSGFNESDNTFIINCSAYFGNSGGPVMAEDENGDLKLAGIVSRYIPYVTNWYNDRESSLTHTEYSNSGYTVCVPIDAVFQLFNDNGI